MGFLFFTLEYPTPETRQSYLREIPPAFISSTFSFYEPLPASANDTDWKSAVTLLREICSESSLLQAERIRPLKPNDENYSAFMGTRWKRASQQIPPELAGLLHTDDNPTPHYDHCAQCTKPQASKRCAKCKIVSYCSRECQAKHWKRVHKASCLAAESRTLWTILHTNDGFLVTKDECRELANILEKDIVNRSGALQDLVKNFAVYFRFASSLGGCFVL